MSSLQEQLLKAGLTTKQKARQANSERRRKNKQKRSGVEVEASVSELAKQSVAEQLEQRKAEQQQQVKAQQQAQAAKEKALRIEQILTHHQVTNTEGEQEYNYTAHGKVKTLHVDEKTKKALINGQLAICGLREQAVVVTKTTAEKLAEIDEQVVWLLNQSAANENIATEDDPYAEFQIPDDLMW